MIKVVLHCHNCGTQIGKEINIETGPPRWVAGLWNKAVEAGWARDKNGHLAYCSNCCPALESPSRKLHPSQFLGVVALVECEGCGTQLLAHKITVEQFFSRDIRTRAMEAGWKYVTLDQGHTYNDFCKSCAVNARQDRRAKLIRLVWSKPTQRAAWDMGISDKALEKQCKRLEVPKPPPGFWAKWHAGHMTECRAFLPEEVEKTLGRDLLDEIYPLEG